MSELDQQVNEYLKPFEELEKENYELKEKLKAVEADRKWAYSVTLRLSKLGKSRTEKLSIAMGAIDRVDSGHFDDPAELFDIIHEAKKQIEELMERGE